MELDYIYTRLQTPFSSVYLAVNRTENELELKKPIIILDNEVDREETVLSINMKTFNLLKGHVESLAGEDLPDINIDKLEVLSCYPIKELEDKVSFVSIMEYYEDCSTKFLIALTDKLDGGEFAIEIGRDIYEELKNYTE